VPLVDYPINFFGNWTDHHTSSHSWRDPWKSRRAPWCTPNVSSSCPWCDILHSDMKNVLPTIKPSWQLVRCGAHTRVVRLQHTLRGLGVEPL